MDSRCLVCVNIDWKQSSRDNFSISFQENTFGMKRITVNKHHLMQQDARKSCENSALKLLTRGAISERLRGNK